MRLCTLAACAAVLIGSCGCMSTQHVERHYLASTDIDTAGSVSCSQQATQDARQWHGPWFAQPDGVRP